MDLSITGKAPVESSHGPEPSGSREEGRPAAVRRLQRPRRDSSLGESPLEMGYEYEFMDQSVSPARPKRVVYAVRAVHELARKERNQFYLEFVAHLSLIALLVSILTWQNVSNTYLQNDALQDKLLDDEFDSTVSHFAKTYWDVMDLEEVWHFLEGPLMSAIYEKAWYNDDPYRREELSFVRVNNRLLGGVQLRQVRVRNNTCPNPQVQTLLKTQNCFGDGTDFRLRDCSAFGPPSNRTKYRCNKSAYSVLWAGPLNYLGQYGQSGYSETLPHSNQTRAAELLAQLKADRWLDKSTAAIAVNLNLLNPSTNLLTAVEILMEFTTPGRILKSKRFITVQPASFDVTRFSRGVLELLAFVLVALNIRNEIARVKRMGFKRYQENAGLWTVVDALISSLLLLTVALRIYVLSTSPDLGTSVFSDRYVDMMSVVEAHQTSREVGAFVTLLCCLKVFHYLRANERLYLVWGTLSRAGRDLLSFCAIFLLCFMGFAIMGHVVFGPYERSFHSIIASLSAGFRLLIGEIGYEPLAAVSPFFAPIYFAIYMVLVFFILVNVFIAILSHHYDQHYQEVLEARKDPLADTVTYDLSVVIRSWWEYHTRLWITSIQDYYAEEPNSPLGGTGTGSRGGGGTAHERAKKHMRGARHTINVANMIMGQESGHADMGDDDGDVGDVDGAEQAPPVARRRQTSRLGRSTHVILKHFSWLQNDVQDYTGMCPLCEPGSGCRPAQSHKLICVSRDDFDRFMDVEEYISVGDAMLKIEIVEPEQGGVYCTVKYGGRVRVSQSMFVMYRKEASSNLFYRGMLTQAWNLRLAEAQSAKGNAALTIGDRMSVAWAFFASLLASRDPLSPREQDEGEMRKEGMQLLQQGVDLSDEMGVYFHWDDLQHFFEQLLRRDVQYVTVYDLTSHLREYISSASHRNVTAPWHKRMQVWLTSCFDRDAADVMYEAGASERNMGDEDDVEGNRGNTESTLRDSSASGGLGDSGRHDTRRKGLHAVRQDFKPEEWMKYMVPGMMKLLGSPYHGRIDNLMELFNLDYSRSYDEEEAKEGMKDEEEEDKREDGQGDGEVGDTRGGKTEAEAGVRQLHYSVQGLHMTIEGLMAENAELRENQLRMEEKLDAMLQLLRVQGASSSAGSGEQDEQVLSDHPFGVGSGEG